MERMLFFTKIIRSYIQIVKFKLIYGSRFKVNFTKKIYFGKNIDITIGKNGKLLINGDFNCRNNNNFNITSGILEIEDGVFFNNGNSINCQENIFIGENTIFGEGIKIYDHDHIFQKEKLTKELGFKKKKIMIGSNVWIGSNSIILKGSEIGDNCVIGAGNIVNKKIEQNCIYYNENKKKL